MSIRSDLKLSGGMPLSSMDMTLKPSLNRSSMLNPRSVSLQSSLLRLSKARDFLTSKTTRTGMVNPSETNSTSLSNTSKIKSSTRRRNSILLPLKVLKNLCCTLKLLSYPSCLTSLVIRSLLDSLTVKVSRDSDRMTLIVELLLWMETLRIPLIHWLSRTHTLIDSWNATLLSRISSLWPWVCLAETR